MRTETEIKALIAETVNYYANPSKLGRPLDKTADGPGCQYITAEGNMCAVGRCLIDPQYVIDNISSTTLGSLVIRGLTGEHFKEEYRGFSYMLWVVLQRYHDNRDEREPLTEEDISTSIDLVYTNQLEMDEEWIRKYLPNLTL